MNIVIKNNQIRKYEKMFRSGEYDINEMPFPSLKKEKEFSKREKQIMLKFIKKLKRIESKLDSHYGFYSLFNIYWNSNLVKYIKTYNMRPSKEFMNFIKRLTLTNNMIKLDDTKKSEIILRLPGIILKRGNRRLIKLTKNQLRIMDALMIDGGFTKKYFDRQNKLRFSEHAGLIDFSNTGLEKIIISGKTNRHDKDDHTILLPDNIIEAYDYEYIFHTHPPTPHPGGRVNQGILYEFPSISDIFHFIDHHNNGQVQGSIIIAPEGIYIIYAYDISHKIEILDDQRVYNMMQRELNKIQDMAISKYGFKFTEDFFYKVIAQDTKYIKIFNKLLQKYNVEIDYHPRIKVNNKWILNELSVRVSAIEVI